ncbi:MAG: S4 domain-containing protein, partial [Candidatus Berkelbacteria bacterium]
MTNKPVRINKFIAQAGIASRRGVDQLIKSGKVLVNNEKAKTGIQINPDMDKVVVGGKEVKPVSDFQYFAFYKPVG